jgi:hypothetical protein
MKKLHRSVLFLEALTLLEHEYQWVYGAMDSSKSITDDTVRERKEHTSLILIHVRG